MQHGNWRVVDGGRFLECTAIPGGYDIPLHQIKKAEKAVGWLEHVGGKTWATKPILLELVHHISGHLEKLGLHPHPL